MSKTCWLNEASPCPMTPSVNGAADLAPTTLDRSRSEWGREAIGGSWMKSWLRSRASDAISGAPWTKTAISSRSLYKSVRILRRLSAYFARYWARRDSSRLKLLAANFAVMPQGSANCCRLCHIAKTGMRTIELKCLTNRRDNKNVRCGASAQTVMRSDFSASMGSATTCLGWVGTFSPRRITGRCAKRRFRCGHRSLALTKSEQRGATRSILTRPEQPDRTASGYTIRSMAVTAYPNLTGNPQSAPRCRAHSRKTGQPCRAPAIRDRKRCRMHGGKGSGAPKDNQNAKTSGHYTAKAEAQQFWLAYLNWLIDRDDRHLSHRLTNPREIRELVKLLRHWGNAMLSLDQFRAIHAVANDLENGFWPARTQIDWY